MSLQPGTRLGVYQIESALGTGGMGEVYRARDSRKLGRDVAIKVLPGRSSSDSERVARFEREAQLLAALNHPNIAGVYGLEQSGSQHFLAMELVEGESLADRLRGGALPRDEALSIAPDREALGAAHEKGIIHRDLKPANVMLTRDGRVKVLDFGLAKIVDPESPAAGTVSMSPTFSLQATMAGTILGTAAYMSPEQARGRIVDKRTDIWAFGCVLFELLSGRRAFEGDDITETIAAVVRAEPNWGTLPKDVPAHVAAVIRRCLVKEPRQRFADISIPLCPARRRRGDAAALTVAPPPAGSGASLGVAAVECSRTPCCLPRSARDALGTVAHARARADALRDRAAASATRPDQLYRPRWRFPRWPVPRVCRRSLRAVAVDAALARTARGS